MTRSTSHSGLCVLYGIFYVALFCVKFKNRLVIVFITNYFQFTLMVLEWLRVGFKVLWPKEDTCLFILSVKCLFSIICLLLLVI